MFLPFLFLLFFCNLRSDQIEIDLLSSAVELSDLVSEQFDHVEYVFDIQGYLSDTYLKQWLGLTSVLTKQNIAMMQFYIRQSEMFKTAFLVLDTSKDPVVCTLRCVMRPVVRNVQLRRVFKNKNRLLNVYGIEPGEFYDEQKHNYGIQNLKNYLHQAGYLCATCHDVVNQDDKLCMVDIACKIHQGQICKIQHIDVHLISDQQDHVQRLQNLASTLQKKLAHVFLYKKCYQKTRASLKKQVVEFLRNHDLSYDSVTIDIQFVNDQGVVLQIACKTHVLRPLMFFGNTFFTGRQIRDHIGMYGNFAFNFPAIIIRDEICQLYKKHGFFDVQVGVEQVNEGLCCSIEQGRRSEIGQILLKNQITSQDQFLIDQAFKKYKNKKYINEPLMQYSCKKLIELYQQQGYWDVAIDYCEYVKSAVSHIYDVDLSLRKGEQKILADVRVQNFEALTHVLKKGLHALGKPLSLSSIIEQKERLLEYGKRHALGIVRVTHTLQQHEHGVCLVWHIVTSDMLRYCGNIIIQGNTRLEYDRVRSLVACSYGEVIQQTDLEKTMQALRSLPTLDTAQIMVGQQVDPLGYRPIFVKIAHASRYEVKARFGLQQVGRNMQFYRGFTYKVGADFCIKRWITDWDMTTLHLDMTRFYRTAQMSYLTPWLGHHQVRCECKLYDMLYQQPVYIGSRFGLYKALQQGVLLNVYKEYDRCVLSNNIGLECLGLYEADQPDIGRVLRYDPCMVGKKIGNLFIEPYCMIRSVDNILNPHEGYTMFATSKIMFNFDRQSLYLKLLAEVCGYIPFFDSLTLALRLRVGHIFNQKFDQIHPIERFYTGGACSVRGYERDYAPPLGLLQDPVCDPYAGLPSQANNCWRYAPQGGRTLMQSNIEMRYATYKNIDLVGFYDCGLLFQDSVRLGLQHIKNYFVAGYGGGIRYQTPIGPFRFDIGIKQKIIKPDFESACVWYITLGQAF